MKRSPWPKRRWEAPMLMCWLILTLARPAPALASPIDERLHLLSSELRCLVCQNEALADSNAPLALDLKREIRSRMEAGQSDEEIRQFLVDRYGDFVSYKPPFNAQTALLWGAPWLLIMVGGLALNRHLKRERLGDITKEKP